MLAALRSKIPMLSRAADLLSASKIVINAGPLPDIAISMRGGLGLGGLGDDIMCGIVARELRKRGMRRVWLFTRFGDLFTGNSDVVAVPADMRARRLCDWIGIRHVELGYAPRQKLHIIGLMCASAGVTGEVELQPKIFLSEKEKRAGKLVPGCQVTIQSSNLQAHWPVLNKQWSAGRFRMVVDYLKHDFNFVQLGMSSDPPLQGSLDLRGKTTPRQAAAILSSSHFFIGLVGGLMHMARAVNCRSIIVYGGREHPSQSGYSANINLHWEGACSPCWERNACNFDRICMQEITSEAVVAAARRQAELFGAPLPVDHLMV